MINENQFDIATWLRDNKHLLDYIKIPGYIYKIENRNEVVEQEHI